MSQVTSIEKVNETKYKCTFSDGAQTIRGILASQLTDLVNGGSLCVGCTVRVIAYVVNKVNDEVVIMATDLEVISAPVGSLEIGKSTPEGKKTPPAALKENRGTMNSLTPGPTPSPSEREE